eukprot:TRINITY_DN77202_c0_g1_i1.p1 TRINITY_DN77202_c0_g1~~TRINITY_DN77202_c0_g1_i1.p1  ORF type:complete len:109 (+),score=5.41 TRINITY_DN77202_c0_g1_i1:50-328(+)
MVSLADLRDIDDFEWQEGEYALVGFHTGLRFGMGDRVKIRVVSANLDKRQIDYTLAEAPQGKFKLSKNKGKQGAAPTRPKQGGGKPKPKRKR